MTFGTDISPQALDTVAEVHSLGLVVGIPSAGRREILAAVLPYILRQTRAPQEIVICVPSASDVDQTSIKEFPCPVRVLISERGSCRQRNHILESVQGADVVVFLDDDFLMSATYLEETERIFAKYPDIDICTGTVIADGIGGPGISVERGIEILNDELAQKNADPVSSMYNA